MPEPGGGTEGPAASQGHEGRTQAGAEPIIEAERVGIAFRKSPGRRVGLRQWLLHGRRRQPKGSFWALRDISFSVYPGEGVGVIGGNGTGKSTLLKMIAGGLVPDEGTMTLRGGVSLLELRAGLAKELTGRDNVFLLGALHGMDQGMLQERFDEIVKFAEAQEFIDTPVRRYSSGMRTRLAFAVAVQLDDPILLVDEVLAVGDRRFKKKCYAAIEKILADGRTLVMVSHNVKDVKRFCSRGLYIRSGQLIVDSTVEDALAAYNEEGKQAKQDKQGNKGQKRQQATEGELQGQQATHGEDST